MRIDEGKYISAKKKIADMEKTLSKYRETVKLWEAAVKELQPAEGQELKGVLIENEEVSGIFGRKPQPQMRTSS